MQEIIAQIGLGMLRTNSFEFDYSNNGLLMIRCHIGNHIYV
jgi:hypothetical protein